MTLNVLLTGFEPFDKDPLNPSWEVARALDRWQPAVMGRAGDAFEVLAAQLPCVFGDAVVRLQAAIAQWQGDDLHLQGLVGSATTGEQVRADARGGRIETETLGQTVAKALLAQGARRFIG